MKNKEISRRAVVMGATSGIGLEVVRELCRRGWQVGIVGRRAEVLEKIQAETDGVIARACIDITHADAPDELLHFIADMGDIDLYFHSSGIGYQNPILDTDKELRTVETNALGFTRMVNAAFNYFAQRERPGHIAVISSIARTKGLGAAPAYSATKRYVSHYMECLQQLCAIRHLRHIRLHDIRPGFVRTPLIADGNSYPMQLMPVVWHAALCAALSATARLSPLTGVTGCWLPAGDSFPAGCGCDCPSPPPSESSILAQSHFFT